jgi:hypothetical protein
VVLIEGEDLDRIDNEVAFESGTASTGAPS